MSNPLDRGDSRYSYADLDREVGYVVESLLQLNHCDRVLGSKNKKFNQKMLNLTNTKLNIINDVFEEIMNRATIEMKEPPTIANATEQPARTPTTNDPSSICNG